MDGTNESDKVNKLYSTYGILADCEISEINQKEAVYEEIIQASKGGEKEKRLACQFMPVFFKYFPKLTDAVIEAMFDLFEDPIRSIRRQALKELPPKLCRDCPCQTKRVAYVLCQLLTVKDPAELRIIHDTMLALIKIDTAGCIDALVNLIKYEDDNNRDNILRFLTSIMRNISSNINEYGKTDFISLEDIKFILKESKKEEIPVILKILFFNQSGKMQVLDDIAIIIVEEIEYLAQFEPQDDEMIERIIVLLTYFNAMYPGAKTIYISQLLELMIENLLPKFFSSRNCYQYEELTVKCVKLLAEITSHADQIEISDNAMDKLICLLKDMLPSCSRSLTDTQLHYTYLECLLYVLHRCVKFNYKYVTESTSKLTSFVKRLKVLGCIVKGYSDKLCEILNLSDAEINPDIQTESGIKRKWPQTSPEPIDNTISDPTTPESRFNELKALKWMEDNSLPCQDSLLQRGNHSAGWADFNNIPEDKKKEIRIEAYETCSNILSLMNDFFKTPINCATKIRLSFLYKGGFKKIDKRVEVSHPGHFINGKMPNTNKQEINNSRPKLALYIPPNGRYSANFRKP